MDNMNIGKAIIQGYGKSKPNWILKMCSPILRVFKHHSFSVKQQRFDFENVRSAGGIILISWITMCHICGSSIELHFSLSRSCNTVALGNGPRLQGGISADNKILFEWPIGSILVRLLFESFTLTQNYILICLRRQIFTTAIYIQSFLTGSVKVTLPCKFRNPTLVKLGLTLFELELSWGMGWSLKVEFIVLELWNTLRLILKNM